MREARGILPRLLGVPDGERYSLIIRVHHQLQAGIPSLVGGRPQGLLVDAGVAQRGEQDKVFSSQDLDVDVFVVVLVHCRDRLGVADPQVDGVRALVQRYPCEWYVLLDV